MKHIDEEYCLPFDNTNPEFWMRLEHLGRYIYAADYIKKHSCSKVLDAACADGYGCIEMASSDTQIYGIDYNRELIEKAEISAKKAGLRNVHFYNRDLNTDSLDWLCDIDLITCFDTLEHLKEPNVFLQKLSSLQQKQGALLLSVPKADFEPVDSSGVPTNTFHLHRFSESDISALLSDAGYSIRKTLYQPYTNMCMSLEKNVLRDTGISPEQARSYYCGSADALRFFARTYAMPDPSLSEFSYSIFIVAYKK